MKNNKKICVIGLGYIGLPTASMLANQGFNVLGVDISTDVVETINKGQIHIKEPGLKTVVQAAVNSGNLKASLKPEISDVFIIAVPTPITKEKKADMTHVIDATKSIAPFLKKGNLIILESTSPPGTTRDILVKELEKTGLKAGEGFKLAYCPERVIQGKIIKELIENDRVIGAIDESSALMAKEIYESFVEGNIFISDATTCEMVKLVENTYRDINIAFANEIAVISEKLGINAWEVIKLANRHPRVNIHNPGPGVGGHCISVDPWFIVEKFEKDANLIRSARKINDNMPMHVVNLILKSIKGIENPKVSILGVTYKSDIDDTRESPAITIIKELEKRNIKFSVYDPHVSDFKYELSDLEETFKDSDTAVIVTDHKEFKYLHMGELGNLMKNKVIIDTRNSIEKTL